MINNPSFAGFMKYAIFSSIRSKGLAINAGIMRPMKTIDGIIVLINPKERNDEKNAKQVAQKIAKKKTQQGIKTRTKNTKVERRKVLMFPIQITLSRASHADSHEKFFKNYSKWTLHFFGFDVETQFIWINPSDRGLQMHPYVPEYRPAHIERYIPFKDVSAAIWQKYQEPMKNADAAQAEPIGHSTASGKVTADETSSEEEVTAAASSTGGEFSLRSRRGARWA